jgi:hypothetical protein
MLGKLLAKEEVAVFDLTPGADAYKETLATDHTLAYTLSIGNNYHGVANRLKAAINGCLKSAAAAIGIKQDTLRKARRNFTLQKVKTRNLAPQGLASLFRFFFSQLKKRGKTSKCWVVQQGFATSGLLSIRKDDLNDLLDLDPRDIRYSQQEFLAEAMKRFEEGAHCYTWAEEGLLLGCAWVTNLQSSIADYRFGHKTDGFIISLSQFYSHPKGRKQLSLFLRSVAKELAIGNPHDKFYIITDCLEEGAFENAGFRRMK